MDRLRELDFLRGIAVLLVLFRHSLIYRPLLTMGWMGVDLFFVLSGFLISGLLFKEYQKFGRIAGFHFLVRRAFKIYPVYYISLPLYALSLLASNHLIPLRSLGDVFFVQNFVNGWGYLCPPSWSLAIEEHFYFGLVLVLVCLTAKNLFKPSAKDGLGREEKIMIAVMVAVLALRVASNRLMPAEIVRNFTMTHLRIDALLSGVLVSYLYYFKRNYLARLFDKWGRLMMPAAVALLAWTPFVEPVGSFFVETVGFTLVYSAFALVLLCILMDAKINVKLDRIFSKKGVNAVSRIGVYSYSIYVFHWLVNDTVRSFYNGALASYITIPLGLIVGALVSIYIESYFLRLRDMHFPSRLKTTPAMVLKNSLAQSGVKATPSILREAISLEGVDAETSSM